NVAISQGFLIRHGRSKRPSAHRQTTNTSNFPTSTPSVTPRPSFPRAIGSQFTSLTRVARYALLLANRQRIVELFPPAHRGAFGLCSRQGLGERGGGTTAPERPYVPAPPTSHIENAPRGQPPAAGPRRTP